MLFTKLNSQGLWTFQNENFSTIALETSGLGSDGFFDCFSYIIFELRLG